MENSINNYLITLWISTALIPKPEEEGYPQGY